ncbi:MULTISPECIES: nucleotidyltransferase domain-containing protein [unclassified Undibacterium]|uniref:nucleotidyltransferase family protein n=1 Tax=unclassified Undibacterium TaxID=2630295 RepID=UPI002AC8DBC4|nr:MULTISPECIES: nucleotidyltransferase domain-containing protein [unclassified Undibacterium]MEB0140657.1 nucleotidyltransferase domain-containing protein [Undibacterium sp. CCC2.1]MEB0172421.1 nucleotidyltransferase domain-containing protein [Undibacterium sp. CCC1.1]MEB0177689.1 nucleotidyltransferase domain-containing protein [Undibacterium sp. CCC3.4]MEB0215543.1 nucleotidyltransferase domain-containing protein [Undibacterium sp. 5I2]WPX43749.1 nucleotidyltransferase domain-containing pro
MSQIDLHPHDLAEVVRILRLHVPELEVWAFGSRAKRTAKAYSDLDLALITEVPLALDRFAALQEAFDESPLPIRVDLVDTAKTSGSFREIIKQHKIVIQFALP